MLLEMRRRGGAPSPRRDGPA